MRSSKHKPLYCINIYGQRVLTLKQSNIVDEEADVIVNAANEQLLHRAGVAGVLNHASAGRLQKVSDAYIAACGPLQMGAVAVTASGGRGSEVQACVSCCWTSQGWKVFIYGL